MKIFKHIFLFLLLMTMIPISAQKVNLEAAFQKLDSYVSKREYYIHKKQSDIDNLKNHCAQLRLTMISCSSIKEFMMNIINLIQTPLWPTPENAVQSPPIS